MERSSFSQVSQRIARLRWQAPLLAFILVLSHQLVEHTWLVHLPRWQHFATQMLFYGLVGPALAWWALTSLRRSVRETEAAESALRLAHEELQDANQRLEFLIRVSRRLSEANDEDALADVILELPLTVVPAVGCSLVRFDEQEQPKLAIHRGELAPDVFQTWVVHLSSPELNHACQHCSSNWAVDSNSCPLIDPLKKDTPVKKVYCLELERGGRQFGVLNIYLSNPDNPTQHEAQLLETMRLEISLALESIHLRSMELATLYRLQQSRKLQDLHSELSDAVHHVVDALDITGGVLFLTDTVRDDFKLVAQAGDPLEGAYALVKGLARSAFETDTPFLINSLDQDEADRHELGALLVSPLRVDQELTGCLVLWTQQANAFSRRHIRLIATVSGQMAVLVENHRLYFQVENQAALAERGRLAREIHDGLAQSLGYLQLRIAQINQWLEQDQVHRVKPALQEVEDLLDGAYVDAREAIDGLRLKPGEHSFENLLEQAGLDFQDLSDIPLEMCESPDVPLSSEVQTHLLRIVQEALGNIRKHSQATHAWLDWEHDGGWLTLRITDNGQGFSPEEVPLISHHGLRIMRERADLLQADFQVIGRPGDGTQVILRLPVKDQLKGVV